MAEKVFVPPIKIQGIKTKLVPMIRENVRMDRNTLWLEPFMGSGVVGFNVEPRQAVFADINPHIIGFYDAIKTGDVTSQGVRAFLEHEGRLLSQRGEEHYYAVRDRFNACHDPMDFLFLNRACFNGMIRFNKNYAFNVPFGHKPDRFSKAYITKIVHQVQYVEECLRRYDWTFLNQSFERTLQLADGHSFVYCDPPYIGRHVDYYDSWDEQSEARLCSMLRASGAPFMLSTWDHNRYRENPYIGSMWGFCHKVTKEHFYFVGAREANRNAMMEALLTNYPPESGSGELFQEGEKLSLAI